MIWNNITTLKQRCQEGIRLRREITPGTLVVNAVPGVGAIEAESQRFFSRQPDGSEHLDATASFTNIWTKESGRWQLLRVITYDRR